jgi:nitroreductase
MKDINDQDSREGGLRALHLLLERRSVATLEDPPPTAAETNLILDAGLRAPDHGRLRPWRFVLIRREARTAFGECLVAAARKRDPAAPQSLLDRYQAWTVGTPLLMAVGARITARHFIPEIEQVLSAGAAAMNMLNAVHLLGYGAIWVTGPNVYDPDINECLGFQSPDRLVGLLAIGTARTTTTKVRRPPRALYVAEWTGPAQSSGQN